MNPLHYPSPELCEKLTNIDFPETEIMLDSINQYRIGGMDVFPSVMEMLDVIPPLTGEHWLSIEKCTTDYHVCMRISSGNETICFDNSILANALAEIILWLVENKYLTFNNEKS